jgi:predicted AlkP superfamily phosphohydrolase/phosphomutase
MRFLRMLTNALLAGALGAAYLTVIVLQLNTQVPIASETTLRWFLSLAIFYGTYLAIVFYLSMVAHEFFSLEILSPGWVSVRVLAWMTGAMSAAAAALMWLNVRGFEPALGETATRRMTSGAAATTAAAVVLLGIAVAHYSSGRRGSRVGAALFVIAAFGSLALPIAARGPATSVSPRLSAASTAVAIMDDGPPRVAMLLLDGASLEYVLLRAAEGRLPNFSRLLDGGATLDLATVRPTGPGSVWASVATGMYPSKTGVRSGADYFALGNRESIDLLPDHCFSHALVHLGLVRQEANDATAWRSAPLWDILSSEGIPVGLVGWPLTYPAPRVLGFAISDRFHELLASASELDERAAYPAAVVPTVTNAFASAFGGEPLPRVTAGFSGSTADMLDATVGLRDRRYSRALSELRRSTGARLLAVRYQGLDTVGHFYMGDTQPGGVTQPTELERRRHLQVLERYYSYIDAEVGDALDALSAGDLLLVVSGYGMQRQNPLKRMAGRLLGDPDLSGTHERAPDGFLMAYGAVVEPGRPQRGSIVDVTPTVLYFLGLPVGRDMDGFARTDLFTRTFTAERPIAFIPTYKR